jgi:non-ribosomal peptide synthetase component E (peptide arylation enzyme)
MVLLPGFTPPDLVATLERSQATVLFAAPAHIAACRQAGLLEQADLSSLKLAVMAGSACPPELVRTLAQRLPNGTVSQLWGMTELQAGAYTRPDDPLEVAATSAGRPSPGTEVRIVAPDATLLGPGEEGELQIRGCSVFPSYFDNTTANAQAFTTDGWFRTGDLAVLDAQGNVRLTGRSKDIINRGGVKFNPLDIENLLDQHPKVVQSAIVPMSDAVLGERACCFAVLTTGQSLTLEEVCAYLLTHHIARHKLPERLEILAEMPLTPTRKIIKGRLQALLAERVGL